MTFQVVLSPSGRTIAVEANETILEAALREGHSVNYHCANGSCGDCRARILDGKVADHRHHDYSFKGQERQQAMLLMCRAVPASDMMIEVKEAVSVDDIPLQKITTIVAGRNFLSDDIVELQLRTPRSQTLRFMAGQHVRLQVNGLASRNKSIASCPCNGRDLRFHIRRSPDDPVAGYVFDSLRLRDQVVVEGPFGDFILDEKSISKVVLIAFETGFAAIKSLIEHAISLDHNGSIQLIWIARDAGGHYLENQCRAWRDALDNFDFSLVRASRIEGKNGFDSAAVKQLVEKILLSVDGSSGIDLYVSIPGEFHDALKVAVEKQMLSDIRIFRDDAKLY